MKSSNFGVFITLFIKFQTTAGSDGRECANLVDSVFLQNMLTYL